MTNESFIRHFCILKKFIFLMQEFFKLRRKELLD